MFCPPHFVCWLGANRFARRSAALLVLGVSLLGCESSPPTPPPRAVQADTVARHPGGAPQIVERRRNDSLVERRWLRPSGMVRRVTRGDSIADYFDLHAIDSSAVLRDYMQGRWRNTSADLSNRGSSAFYTFSGDTLTFTNPEGRRLETIRIDFKPDRLMVTEDGIPAPAEVTHFDTVRVTGYTLVRENPVDVSTPDSTRPPSDPT